MFESLSPCKRIIVIGVSAGGPQALQHFLPLFPSGFEHPLFVIQHYANQIVGSLIQTLTRACHLPLELLSETRRLPEGGVYLCPPGHQCVFGGLDGVPMVRIEPDEERLYRPSIDVTMESAAHVFGERVIGVLLTGMGKDGVEGLRAIQKVGGLTIAESEETAIVFGMPREAMKAGVVQRVLPLHQIPTELLLSTHSPFSGSFSSEQLPQVVEPEQLCQSIEQWAESGDVGSMRAVLECLRDPNPIVVESAGSALKRFPMEVLFPYLLPLLQSKSPAIRTIAIELTKKHLLEPENIALLAPLCVHRDQNLRLFALECLSNYPPASMEEKILSMTQDENANVGLKALELLFAYDSDAALGALTAALEEAPERRATAIFALGRSHSPKSLGILLSLEQRSFEDTFLWFHALEEHNDLRVLPVILSMLSTLDARLLPHALSALFRISSTHRTLLDESNLSAIQELPFEALLASSQEATRTLAIRILGLFGSTQHLDALMAFFAKAQEHEQSMVVDVLAVMSGPEAKEQLRKISESENLEVSTHALELLED